MTCETLFWPVELMWCINADIPPSLWFSAKAAKCCHRSVCVCVRGESIRYLHADICISNLWLFFFLLKAHLHHHVDAVCGDQRHRQTRPPRQLMSPDVHFCFSRFFFFNFFLQHFIDSVFTCPGSEQLNVASSADSAGKRTSAWERRAPASWTQNQIPALRSCRKSQHQWVIAFTLRVMCRDMSAAARLPQQWGGLRGLQAAVRLLLWHLEWVKLVLHSLYPTGEDEGWGGCSWKHMCMKHTVYFHESSH